MADKQVKIKIVTETDAKKLDDLKKKIKEADGEIIDVELETDDTELENSKKEIDDLKGEKADIDINADDSEIRTVQKEVDDLKGENVDIEIHVDDSEIKNAEREVSNLGGRMTDGLGSTQNAVTGLVSTMAGKSVWDIVYGTSTRAETNKVLLKGMSDATVNYEDFYKTIDKTTDESLISMQSLIPGLNGIQKATGATGAQMQAVTPKVAQFGQYVLALTGSEAQAESAMFDLSKGIKGAWASLDQYGITEESLMDTGLWSGKEEDVEGYMNAVNAVTGDTSDLMDTTVGLEALMGKAFSRAGKKIGNELLPVVKNLLQIFLKLDDSTGGWLSTGLLIAGGALTGMVSLLSILGQALNGVKMMRDAYIALSEAEVLEGITGWFSIGWLLAVIAIGVAVGLLFIYLYNNVDWFRQGVDNLISTLQWLVGYISSSVIGTFNWLGGIFTNFTSELGLNTSNWAEAILGFILFLPQLPLRVGQLLIDTLAKAMGFGNNFTSTMINGAMNSVNGFLNWIYQLPGKLYEELQKMLKMAADFAMRIADTLSFGGASMVTGWEYGSGEQSPGFMYDDLVEELEAMTNAPQKYSNTLARNVSNVGSGMVNAFDISNMGDMPNNLRSYDNYNNLIDSLVSLIGEPNKNEINLTLNIGTVDKRERIQEIIDVITNEVMWNNITAGRSR